MPQTYLRNLSAETITRRAALMRHHLNVGRKLWELIGDGKVGAVLLDRFWSGGDPWVTVDYVTAALDGIYSDDTVRRRLAKLVEHDCVLQRRDGRITLYAMRPSIAEEIAEIAEMVPLSADCGEKLADNRNLRENFVVVGPYETHRELNDT